MLPANTPSHQGHPLPPLPNPYQYEKNALFSVAQLQLLMISFSKAP